MADGSGRIYAGAPPDIGTSNCRFVMAAARQGNLKARGWGRNRAAAYLLGQMRVQRLTPPWRHWRGLIVRRALAEHVVADAHPRTREALKLAQSFSAPPAATAASQGEATAAPPPMKADHEQMALRTLLEENLDLTYQQERATNFAFAVKEKRLPPPPRRRARSASPAPFRRGVDENDASVLNRSGGPGGDACSLGSFNSSSGAAAAAFSFERERVSLLTVAAEQEKRAARADTARDAAVRSARDASIAAARRREALEKMLRDERAARARAERDAAAAVKARDDALEDALTRGADARDARAFARAATRTRRGTAEEASAAARTQLRASEKARRTLADRADWLSSALRAARRARARERARAADAVDAARSRAGAAVRAAEAARAEAVSGARAHAELRATEAALGRALRACGDAVQQAAAERRACRDGVLDAEGE